MARHSIRVGPVFDTKLDLSCYVKNSTSAVYGVVGGWEGVFLMCLVGDRLVPPGQIGILGDQLLVEVGLSLRVGEKSGMVSCDL